MRQLFRLAFRNLGRNRRRSAFSALALGLGLAVLLLMAATVAGEMRSAMDQSIRLETGHLQVRASSFEEGKSSLALEDLIADPEVIAAQVATLAPVAVATPRLLASGIVLRGEESFGVRLIGVDPTSPANAPFSDGLQSGSLPAADDREGILVGASLATRLGLSLNDTVRLMVNTSNGDVDEQSFVVRGICSTGVPSYDEVTVLMPLAKAQAITRTDRHASIIYVLLHNRDQAPAVAAALSASPYQIATYEQMNALLVQTSQLSDAYMAVIYLIVLAITATVIVNTLLMAVFERTREIGILTAIGMRSGRIMALFLAESFLLATGGVLIGLALGAVLVAYASRVGFYIGNVGATSMYLGERIYAYLVPRDAISLTIAAFAVTLLASLYPARLAAQMEPVDALRH